MDHSRMMIHASDDSRCSHMLRSSDDSQCHFPAGCQYGVILDSPPSVGCTRSTSSILSACSTLPANDNASERIVCTVRIAQRRVWRNCVACGDLFNRNDTLAAADTSVSVGKEYASLSSVAIGICDGCYGKVRRCGGRLPQFAKINAKDNVTTPGVVDSSNNRANGGRGCGGAVLGRAMAASRHPVLELLTASGFVQHKYDKIRADCLYQRAAVGAGNSPDLKMLYEFWTQFLQTTFNKRMYNDFKRLAIEDYRAHCYFGIECLLDFFSTSLENKIRPLLLADFHELALFTHANGHLCGMQALLAFLRKRKDPLSVALLDGLGELATETLSAVGMKTDSMADWPEISHKRHRAERSPDSVPLEPRRIRRLGLCREDSELNLLSI